jgi:hypothetical protein
MTCLPGFNGQLPESQTEYDHTADAIAYLETPAPRKWIAGRVVTLLSHFFVAQQEAAVVEAVADDWCAILDKYPAWAIANACRWWLSRENPRKHCKPLPGDIEDRAVAELSRVRVARISLERGISRPRAADEIEVPRTGEWWTAEERQRRKDFAQSVLRAFAIGTEGEASQ